MEKKKVKPLRIGKIFGIDIIIDSSWFIIFIIVIWSLATSYFPRAIPGQSSVLYWLLGVLASLMLFTSVLAHELAHSLVARRFKISVKKITLLLLGGIAWMEENPKSPKAEFLIAAAGPFASIFLAAIFFILAKFVVIGIPPLMILLWYLSLMNFILAVFNVVVFGYPTDGGRILRAIVWKITGNELKSAKIASVTGQISGTLMIFYGVYLYLHFSNFGGLWLVLIGFFLFSAAKGGYTQILFEKKLRGVAAREVMDNIPEAFKPVDTEQEVICDAKDDMVAILKKIQEKKCNTIYVVENGQAIGIITIEGISRYIQSKLQRRQK